MIFLSAQPGEYYFTWQLDLQISNFNQVGVKPAQIHILIGYDTKKGVPDFYAELSNRNRNKATFYFYPDTRKDKTYLPSIRPHIISKHLLTYPALEESALFYHDSDIIFRELPDFTSLLSDENWYVSDTRSYLDSEYIKNASDVDLFQTMCKIVGISPKQVLDNDTNCGGAQYLLKKTTASFWDKVEKNCTELFKVLTAYNAAQKFKEIPKRDNIQGDKNIQAWCADMWALFWNAIHLSKKVLISSELDFCWATSKITEWNEKKILHYTGPLTSDKKIFNKVKYFYHDPYYDTSLKNIDLYSCSYPLIELISEYKKQLDEERIDLTDVSFIIPVRIDSESRLQNLLAQITYLSKYFKTNIIIHESDDVSKISPHLIPHGCRLIFEESFDQILHRTRLNNAIIDQITTPIIALIESDIILSNVQIEQAVEIIRKKEESFVSPYDGQYIKVDNLFKTMFEKILDPLLLVLNKNKFKTSSKRSWDGCLFLSGNVYEAIGNENELFESKVPANLERIKRIKNSGYTVHRIDGPIFHLPHDPNNSSPYSDSFVFRKNIEEYFAISNMSKEQLLKQISVWKQTSNYTL